MASNTTSGLTPRGDLLGQLERVVVDANLGRARTFGHLGWLLGGEGRHAEALHHKLRALELYQLAGDRRGQARAYNQIGWSYVVLGEYEQALE